MEKYYLDKALSTAREMIHAYFDDKDINVVLKHLSAENFSFMGVKKDAVFNSREIYRKYAESFFEYIGTYEIIEEKYSIISESEDSCLVLAVVKQIDTFTENICALNYFFYFKEFGEGVICPHYHVSRQLEENLLIRPIYFNEKPTSTDKLMIFYPRTRKIKLGGKIIDLTPLESEIFLILADNLNEPIMPEEIYEKILLNSEIKVLSNVLPMHISNIRRKLRAMDESIKIIYVKGKGYCLKA